MNKIVVVTLTGLHSTTTREHLVSTLEGRGHKVEIFQSRASSGVELLKLDGNTVGRIFQSDAEAMAWQMARA